MSTDPPTDLRARIAEALAAKFTPDGRVTQGMRAVDDDPDEGRVTRRVRPLEAADAVLAVLPPPADRAAVLAEAIRRVEVERDATDVNVAEYPRYDWKGRAALEGALRVLRRMAAEAQQQPDTETREWCKCPPCWGWFVENHPGEDLDDLGKDLSWWSGLPVHRDVPAGAAAPAEQPAAADGGEEAEPVVEPHCDGFPTTCPNPVTVPPAPPHHDGGIRCGCYDEEAQ